MTFTEFLRKKAVEQYYDRYPHTIRSYPPQDPGPYAVDTDDFIDRLRMSEVIRYMEEWRALPVEHPAPLSMTDMEILTRKSDMDGPKKNYDTMDDEE